VLIAVARSLYVDKEFGVQLNQTVYALDTTPVDLCLSLFAWAQFRRRKSAMKLRTLLDLRGSIPTGVIITGGQIHEVNILNHLKKISQPRSQSPFDPTNFEPVTFGEIPPFKLFQGSIVVK
jgi:hypothetical protein